MPVYKEKFHLLTERASLDAIDCVDLFFNGLLPTLKLANNIYGHSNFYKETCRELGRVEAHIPFVETASNYAQGVCSHGWP